MTEKRVTVWVQRFKDRPHLVLQWFDPDTGRRKSQSAGTADLKVAEQRRTDLEADLNHGRHRERGRLTWEKFRELFEAEYVAGLRESTRLNYRTALDLFEELCRPKRVADVGVRTVSAFAAALRSRPGRGREHTAPSTVAARLKDLRSALGWALSQRLIAEVPEFPKVKVPKKLPAPVAAEAFERLLAKAPDPQLRAYLLCGWLAGLRLSEAYHLEWEPSDKAPWVDLARDRIWLPADFAKAGADQWVPLDPQLREALEALPRQGRRVFRFEKWGGRPVQPQAVGRRVVTLARRAGVKLSMHTLRKGFGSRYAARVPAQILQRLMRHGNIRTTMDYYANVDQAVEEAVLGKRPAQPPAQASANPTQGGRV